MSNRIEHKYIRGHLMYHHGFSWESMKEPGFKWGKKFSDLKKIFERNVDNIFTDKATDNNELLACALSVALTKAYRSRDQLKNYLKFTGQLPFAHRKELVKFFEDQHYGPGPEIEDFYAICCGFKGYRELVLFVSNEEVDKKQAKKRKEFIESGLIVSTASSSERTDWISHSQKSEQTTNKEVDESQAQTNFQDNYTPRLESRRFFPRRIFHWIRLKLGYKAWLYDFGINAPLGLGAEDLEEMTKNYVSSDYQVGQSSFEETAKREKDVLNHLYKKVVLKKYSDASDRISYYFVFSSSGIGKTSLLLKLYILAKKRTFNGRIYFLPFSQWRKVKNLTLTDKKDSILLLDALDEDFSVRNPSSLKAVSDEFRIATQDFDRVVITSRNQFFRSDDVIKTFTKTVGEKTELGYQILSLCPFSESQIQKFIRWKFDSSEKRNLAHQTIDLIGDDTSQRQLLISKIELLFQLVTSEKLVEEIRMYTVFQTLLENWLRRERIVIRDIVGSSEDEHVSAFSKTMEFCQLLAKNFVLHERDYSEGFSFEEIEGEFSESFDKSKLLINRTFLVRDVQNRYRFAHQSILEFFVADLASRNEEFDLNFFQGWIDVHGSDFAKDVYHQTKYVQITEFALFLNKFDQTIDLEYTEFSESLRDFELDMRYEPFFYTYSEDINEQRTITIGKCHWQKFKNLARKPTTADSIVGLKLGVSDALKSLDYIVLPEALIPFKLEQFERLEPLLRFFPNLRGMDLCDVGASPELVNILVERGVRYLNLRNTPALSVGEDWKDFKALNLRGINSSFFYNLSFKISARTIIVDYHPKLFKLLRYQKIDPIFRLYVHLNQELMESNDLYEIGRLNVLSKVTGKKIFFFTEDTVLDWEMAKIPFQTERKQKLEAFERLNLFCNRGYYTSYGKEAVSITMSKGYYYTLQHPPFSSFEYLPITPKFEPSDIAVDLTDVQNISLPTLNKISARLADKIKLLSLNFTGDLSHAKTINLATEQRLDTDFLHLKVYDSVRKQQSFTKKEKLPPRQQKVIDEMLNYNVTAEFKDLYASQLFLEGIENKIGNKDSLSDLFEAKHVIITGYLNEDVFQTFNTGIVESIAFRQMRETSEFGLKILQRTPQVMSAKIHISDDIELDFASLMPLEKLVELSIIADKNNLKIVNGEVLFKKYNFESLTLILQGSSRLEATPTANNVGSLRILTVSGNLMDEFFGYRFNYESLEYFEIFPEHSEEAQVFGIDLEFLSSTPKLKTLLIWLVNAKFEGHEWLKKTSVESLTLNYILPTTDELLGEFRALIDAVGESSLKKFELYLISSEEVVSHNALIKTVFKILLDLELDLTVQIVAVPAANINETGRACRIEFNDLKNDGILSVAKSKTHKLSESISDFIFLSVYYAARGLVLLKKVTLYDINIPRDIFETRELNICQKKFREIGMFDWGSDFLNTDFQYQFGGAPKLEIDSLPLKIIRFINLSVDGVTFMANNFGKNVEKISFSSLQKLGLSQSTMDLYKQVKEIEILVHYMPRPERINIPKYVEMIESLGLKASVRKEPLKIRQFTEGILLHSRVSE